MFELYFVKDYEETQLPFSKKLIDTYEDEKSLIYDYDFTPEEFESAINGNVIRNKFLIKTSYLFLQERKRKKKIAKIIEANPEGIPDLQQIADITGRRYDTTYKLFQNAMKKLKNNRQLRDFYNS